MRYHIPSLSCLLIKPLRLVVENELIFNFDCRHFIHLIYVNISKKKFPIKRKRIKITIFTLIKINPFSSFFPTIKYLTYISIFNVAQHKQKLHPELSERTSSSNFRLLCFGGRHSIEIKISNTKTQILMRSNKNLRV